MMSSSMKKVEGVEIIELPTEWPVGDVNLFLIQGEKLTLVDAGRELERAWDLFLDALNKLGLSIMDIEQVFLTHHHTDHIGLLKWFLEKNPVPVYAHKNCIPYLKNDPIIQESSKAFYSVFYKEFGIPEELTAKLAEGRNWNAGVSQDFELAGVIDEGDKIPGLSEWEVIEVKGHAQSQLGLYRPKDKVFICADHLIKHSPAGMFLEAPILPETERAKPYLQYISNLKKCLNYPIEYTISSHGEPIDDLPGFIQYTLQKIDKRARKVKQRLITGTKSGYDLLKELYPGRHDAGIGVLVSDTVGLLDLLIERGEVKAEKENGVIYYSLT